MTYNGGASGKQSSEGWVSAKKLYNPRRGTLCLLYFFYPYRKPFAFSIRPILPRTVAAEFYNR